MKNNKRSVTFCGSSVHFHMFSLKAKSDLIYCILHFLPERKYWVLSLCVWLLEDMSFILVRNVVIMCISSALSLPGDGWIESIFSEGCQVCRRPLISRPSWSLSGWTGSVLFVLRKLSETHSHFRIHVTAVLELFNISHDLHQQVVTQVICWGTCSFVISIFCDFILLLNFTLEADIVLLYSLHLFDNLCYSLFADSISNNTFWILFLLAIW